MSGDLKASLFSRSLHSPRHIVLSRGLEAPDIPGRLLVVGVGRISPLEGLEGLTQDSTPAGTFLPDESAGFCFVIATEWASWHSLFSNQAGPAGEVSPV